MEKFEKQFLVALHTLDVRQVREEAHKILEAGAHGVLLVNNAGDLHSSRSQHPNLFDVAESLKKRFPEALVGVNPLDLMRYPDQAVKRLPKEVDILWTDDGGIIETGQDIFLQKDVAEALIDFKGKYFGGIAFKYLPQPKDFLGVARVAGKHFDAVITSGEETGCPPTVEKIRTLYKANIGKPIGIASGMSVENLANYIPYADIFIVATSLLGGDDFTYSREKIKAFRDRFDELMSV